MKIEGIINLNKPCGITSAVCVQIVRRAAGVKRVGHAGTLDPNASGVLPVCIGSAARVTEYLELDFKEYRCEMILGLCTATQDIWGEVISDERGGPLTAKLSREAVLNAFDSHRGLIEQTPPMYSAVRVNGRRLYEYARAGETAEVKSRKVFIKDISVKEIDLVNYKVTFEAVCSKGTYIRTIASDVGEKLGCGGAMSSLVRLASGVFDISGAVTPDELKTLDEDGIRKLIKPADCALIHFGKAFIPGEDRALWFASGGYIARDETEIEKEPEYAAADHPVISREEYKRAYNVYGNVEGKREFLGVAFYDGKYKRFKADKVFYVR